MRLTVNLPRSVGAADVVDCSSLSITGSLDRLDLSSLPYPPTALLLGGNSITALGPSFVNASTLTSLDVSNNTIGSVDAYAFASVSKLSSLDMSSNAELQALPRAVFYGLWLLTVLQMDAPLKCNAVGGSCISSHTPSGASFTVEGTC